MPRIDLSKVPPMRVSMGAAAAYDNGYKHGYEGVVTQGICILIRDSDEHKAWLRGYAAGEGDASEEGKV